MANLWQKLTHFQGNGWWNLPQSQAAQPNPQHEGPIGGPWLMNWWNWLTYGGKGHAGPRFYWGVGFFLAVVTLIEVWAFGWEWLGAWFIPLLLFLSVLKFVGVVAYFMHLRFDNRFYTYTFVSAMIVGIAIFSAILLLAEYAHQEPLF